VLRPRLFVVKPEQYTPFPLDPTCSLQDRRMTQPSPLPPNVIRRRAAAAVSLEPSPPQPPHVCSGCQHAKAYRLPIHTSLVDGRSDWDWHVSVVAYLKWRAGIGWRPARHSGECSAQSYRDALHVVTLAFHQPSPTAYRVLSTEYRQEAA